MEDLIQVAVKGLKATKNAKFPHAAQCYEVRLHDCGGAPDEDFPGSVPSPRQRWTPAPLRDCALSTRSAGARAAGEELRRGEAARVLPLPAA